MFQKFFYTSFALFVTCSLLAGTSPLNKQYCQPEQCDISEGRIVVYHDNGVFEVEALFSDQGGLYFFNEMMRCVFCHRPLNAKNFCETPYCYKKLNPKNTCQKPDIESKINPKNTCEKFS